MRNSKKHRDSLKEALIKYYEFNDEKELLIYMNLSRVRLTKKERDKLDESSAETFTAWKEGIVTKYKRKDTRCI